MAYSKEYEDDISILSMSQLNEKYEYKMDLNKLDKDLCPSSMYALQISLKEIQERCKRAEDSYAKSQQAVKEFNRRLNEKDHTCNQLRKKISIMSQDMSHLHDSVQKLKNEKVSLQQQIVTLKNENDIFKSCLAGKDGTIKSDEQKSADSQDLSQKLLMKMKKEINDIDSYSRMLSSGSSFDKCEDPDQYHSHKHNPEAPCPCILAPCAVTVDNDSNIDTMINDCSNIKSELANHTDSLRSSITVLKTLVNNKNQSSHSSILETGVDSDTDQNFVSNIATYNSIIDENFKDEFNMSSDRRPSNGTPTVEDRCCPICDAIYPMDIPFEEYESHVLTHFDSEGDEITHNFEVIG